MKIQELFHELKRTAIRTNHAPAQRKLPIGKSKFGGKPHMPEGFEWPYYKGTDFEDILKNRPLSFLAQINLEEISGYDKDNQLPHKGILYFFYELCTMKWGFDPKDKGCAKVVYAENADDLQEIDFPKDMEEDFVLPEFELSFADQADLPDYEEIAEFGAEFDWDTYDEERALYGCEEPEEGICKLLGYADLIQGSMLMECERVKRGIYCGNEPDAASDEQREAILQGSKDWILLFQMSTVATEDYELMFGDCGNIYFYIRKQDLQEKQFEHTWLILQCF